MSASPTDRASGRAVTTRTTYAPPNALRDEVLRGLQATPKTLPPKLFYDEAGAALFERICELPEYYLTRTELGILTARVPEIATLLGPHVALIEYGSGAATKVRLLLDALHEPAMYLPVDISRAQLADVAAERQREYPDVVIHPIHADYTRPFALPALPPDARRVAFFPGSTIGNFEPADAVAFLRRIRETVGEAGALVLGVDRRKDAAELEAAYDDAAGVTAAFNRNVLVRLNREFEADFDVDAFVHRAVFDAVGSRVEMHLVATSAQRVRVAGEVVRFAAGESIHTESSYKYDEAMLGRLAADSGFSVRRRFTDRDERFWVVVLEALAPAP